MFAREGYPFILGAAALAAVTFALALRMRSWQLWLVAFVLTVASLWVAWSFRDPARAGERDTSLAAAPAGSWVVLMNLPTSVERPTRRVSIFPKVVDVPGTRNERDGTVVLAQRKVRHTVVVGVSVT